MTSPFNEEAIISCVKSKRFLWDIKHPDYKNISFKTEEFENIGRNFNLTGKLKKGSFAFVNALVLKRKYTCCFSTTKNVIN